jgi:hypothetical protein
MGLGTNSLAQTTAPASTGRALTGALIGSAGGALVGGITGLWIGGNRCIDPGNPDSCDWLRGMVVGVAVGTTLGAPVGAHLLNRRRGALHYSLLASAVIAGAGIVALRAADRSAQGSRRTATLNGILIGVPVLQVIAATVIETRTSRR